VTKYYFGGDESGTSKQDSGKLQGRKLKRDYTKPELVVYGLVGNLTQAESSGGTESMDMLAMFAMP